MLYKTKNNTFQIDIFLAFFNKKLKKMLKTH